MPFRFPDNGLGVAVHHEDLETDLEFLRGLSPKCCSDLTELSVSLHLHDKYPILGKCIPLSQKQIAGRCLEETRPCGFCKSCLVDKIETWLEQTVMGDKYDSHAIGKSDETPSNWLIKEWKTFVFWNRTRGY